MLRYSGQMEPFVQLGALVDQVSFEASTRYRAEIILVMWNRIGSHDLNSASLFVIRLIDIIPGRLSA